MESFSALLNNPFPGLRPFEENESFLFFGREKHLEDIFGKLDAHRFVALVGSSGSGKSSLVKAGIIPMIKQDPKWHQTTLRPGNDPIERLASALGKLFDTDAGQLMEILNRSTFGLVEIVRKHLTDGKKIFILVDQFEEIFRFDQATDLEGNKNRGHFMDLLLEAYSQREIGIYIMLTLRSDFVGECDMFYGLPEAMNNGQYLIPRLRNEELERIITGPVLHAGGKIAPRLVQRLVHDIRFNPDQLPVLQHVLMRTWELWEKVADTGKPIDIEQYEKTGGVQNALNNHAEEAYANLTPYNQKLAKRIFSAITTKTSDNRGIRRPLNAKRLADIAGISLDELWKTAAPFREPGTAFLIPTESMPANENSMVDISHESLMRNWGRLSAWVEEEYESANFYLRLAESARLYTKGKTGMWRDPDLQLAVSWNEKQVPTQQWANLYDPDLSLAIRFIDESSKEKLRGLAEKKRRVMISRTAVVSFLATSGILSLWALRERKTSEDNAQLAFTEEKKAQEQGKLALEQSKIAKEQEEKAKQNLLIAQAQQRETEKQRSIAESNLQEAALQRELAEQSSRFANEQRIVAESERTQAIRQKQISDSLRIVSVKSEQQANRLRLLALAENLAIKSKQLQNSQEEKEIQGILALEAYRLMEENNGNLQEPELFEAMQSAFLNFKGNKFLFHSDAIKGICFNGNSNNIISCGDDGNVFVTENGISKILLHKAEILERITSDETGSVLAYSGRTTQENNNIYLYDVDNKTEKQIKLSQSGLITGIAIKGNLVMSVGLDKQFVVRDKRNADKVITSFTASDRITSLTLTKVDSMAYFVCENGDVYQYDLTSPEKTPVIFNNFKKGKPNCIAASPDGAWLAIGNYEGNLVLTKTKNKEIIGNIQMHASKITGCAITAQGQLVTSSLDKTTKMLDLNLLDARPIMLQEQREWVENIALNHDGTLVASGGREKVLYANNIQSKDLRNQLVNYISRNLTQQEWSRYIGNDIPYHATVTK